MTPKVSLRAKRSNPEGVNGMLIEIKNISKSFNGLKVLENISLSVSSGESIAIVGPSGVGKSTLLRIIAGLDEPDSGTVKVSAKKISMVFQYSALLNSYTVSENIALALQKNGNIDTEKKVTEVLKLVGLEKYKNYFPDDLSGGQRKRVGFARAVASEPEIILYDEPTSGLDPVLSTLVEDYIIKLSKEYKVASVIVTHQMSTIKRTVEKVYMLYGTKILFEGTPHEFINSSNPYVKQFVSADIEGPMLQGLLE